MSGGADKVAYMALFKKYTSVRNVHAEYFLFFFSIAMPTNNFFLPPLWPGPMYSLYSPIMGLTISCSMAFTQESINVLSDAGITLPLDGLTGTLIEARTCYAIFSMCVLWHIYNKG